MLMLLTLSFGFASCSDDDDEDSIVGSWRYDDDATWYSIVTFNSNGTYVWTDYSYYNETWHTMDTEAGTYSFRDGILMATDADGDMGVCSAVLKDGKLLLDGDLYYRVK